MAEPAAYPSLSITFDPQLKTPYSHHASIGVDRALRAGIEVSARAVYIRGFDQVGQVEYNPVVNGARVLDVNGIRGTSASLLQFTSWADSWYRGVIVSVQKRLGRRSQFLAVYTFSKAEDMAADHVVSQPQENGFGRNPANPTGLPLGFNPDSERGPSLQDQRHRFVLSGLYLLPARITVSGIITLGAGRPYNIIAGSDLNGDGILDNDRPWRVANDLPTRIGRNAGLLPGTSALDVRVAKRFGSGRRSLDLMLEMFNLLDHTNYTAVNAVFGRGSYPDEPLTGFGQFTKAGPPFQAQLAVRITL